MAAMQRRRTIEGSCQTNLNVDSMDNKLDTGIQNYRLMGSGHCFVRPLSSQNGSLDGFKMCVLWVTSKHWNMKTEVHVNTGEKESLLPECCCLLYKRTKKKSILRVCITIWYLTFLTFSLLC
uniref:Uncharacterized protein n=1 Tax=Sphaerodactylus townsendi TaxID=933632 RepID=A0ACB8ES58_9SAUR